MQVILLDKVANLGQLGEVVRVKDGYGRNFLIPQGMARRATQKAIAEFEDFLIINWTPAFSWQ